MLNFEKVKKYLTEKINQYKGQYPIEIFEGVKVSVNSGSFGACLISIEYGNENPHNLATVNYQYVAHYNDIDGVVSRWVIRNYELLAERVYREHQKEKAKGMRCVLQIFNNNELINCFVYDEPEQVKSELVKIVISEKKRGTRTTYKPIPYSNDIRITQRWKREEIHTSCNIRYDYYFYNLDY